MKLEVYKELQNNINVEIECFLKDNNSIFNPLFSTNIWGERLKELLSFEYEFLIIKEKSNILAVQLIFKGYKGYSKINNLPFFIKEIARVYSKFFYGYINWYNLIVFHNELDQSEKEDAKKLIYNHIISKNKIILCSPIYDEDLKFFQSNARLKQATYIIDTQNKTYEEVYTNFRRQARKSIEKTIADGVHVKTLSIDEIDNYAKWVEENENETGKSYRLDKQHIQNEYKIFQKENFIYEIFVAYKDNIILGSLGIWGFGNFITEFGVYQSKYAKEKKLYVQDVIKDYIVKYMFENNIKYYDLAGFNPNENLTLKEKAIKQFKAKFRGDELIYTCIKG